MLGCLFGTRDDLLPGICTAGIYSNHGEEVALIGRAGPRDSVSQQGDVVEHQESTRRGAFWVSDIEALTGKTGLTGWE